MEELPEVIASRDIKGSDNTNHDGQFSKVKEDSENEEMEHSRSYNRYDVLDRQDYNNNYNNKYNNRKNNNYMNKKERNKEGFKHFHPHHSQMKEKFIKKGPRPS